MAKIRYYRNWDHGIKNSTKIMHTDQIPWVIQYMYQTKFARLDMNLIISQRRKFSRHLGGGYLQPSLFETFQWPVTTSQITTWYLLPVLSTTYIIPTGMLAILTTAWANFRLVTTIHWPQSYHTETIHPLNSLPVHHNIPTRNHPPTNQRRK